MHFETPLGVVRAVEEVSFHVEVGECCAMVGESACGKTVTALALSRLIHCPPGRYVSGRILFRGRDILSLPSRELRRLRGNRISYIFQEPAVALNPVFRIGYQIGEAIRLHRGKRDVYPEVEHLLEMVGMPDPRRALQSYPHQLSGGMQQRAMIAMALACNPDLLVADEPTTALDVTIQAQILDLLRSLQSRVGMAVLFITHNLALVRGLARRIYVMYAGQLVEEGPTSELLDQPLHPYTRSLIAAVPRLRRRGVVLEAIPGAVPDALNPPPGCRFQPRCRWADERCARETPDMVPVLPNRRVRCFRWKEILTEDRGT
ncbi:MAG: dipeptide ABC transporter ATP-binding protein DppD [Verrucomicrobia bacterium]|nr:MAG: dipeptide ABC transporter ATP-binding protein DppD [Verrucomicrobiota bacterium]